MQSKTRKLLLVYPGIRQQNVTFGRTVTGKKKHLWQRIQKKVKNKWLDLYEDTRDWFKEFFSIIHADMKNLTQWLTRK